MNIENYRCTVILTELEREKTHKITKELDEGCGSISILLTISGTTASETISDLTTYEVNPKEKDIIENRYVSNDEMKFIKNSSTSSSSSIELIRFHKTIRI